MVVVKEVTNFPERWLVMESLYKNNNNIITIIKNIIINIINRRKAIVRNIFGS